MDQAEWILKILGSSKKEARPVKPAYHPSHQEKNMRFQFLGKTYAIEFQREFKQVTLPYFVEIQSDEEISVPVVTNTPISKYPFTTVRLVEVDDNVTPPNWKAPYSATVGAWKGEKKVSLEKGRIAALRRLTPYIPKEMREPMWLAYVQRVKG